MKSSARRLRREPLAHTACLAGGAALSAVLPLRAVVGPPSCSHIGFPNVRRLRSKNGLSQKVLADKVGISVSYVSMLERGQRSPPLETIEKMAKALGVPPGALLGGR